MPQRTTKIEGLAKPMTLSKSDGAVVVNSSSAGFVTTVASDVALVPHSDGLGSISIFFGFGHSVQLNKSDDKLLYSISNGFFLSSQGPFNSNFQFHNCFGDLVRDDLFRKAKDSDQPVSGVSAEQTRQNPLV